MERVDLAVVIEECEGSSPSPDGRFRSNGSCKTPPLPVNIAFVDLNPDWVKSIDRRSRIKPRKLKATSTRPVCSIFRAPHSLRRHDMNAYTPQVISIGPFHRCEERLRTMEEHKWMYLDAVLDRHGRDFLETLLMVAKTSEKRARGCYSEEIELDSDSFAQMMVLDGVFLIELFYRSFSQQNYEDDPIMMFPWLESRVWEDLVMLENQIPFFILQHLFDLMNPFSPPLPILAIKYIVSFYPEGDDANISNMPNVEIHHLLHLVHSYILPPLTEQKPPKDMMKMIPSASELQKAGIKFRIRKANSFLDIKFHDGVIEIPSLTISDRTNVLFRNIIAFEECSIYCRRCFIPYATFMDCLIDSAEDVGILSGNEIIDNWLCTKNEVANLFNKIVQDTILANDHYLVDVFRDINAYCGRRWPTWRAALMRNHLNNPWTIISLVAGFILLVLAAIQTFFTSFPNFSHG